jgi:microcystin-dependent protein
MKKQIIFLFIVLASFANTNQIQAQGDEPILGEIVMFAGNFAPRGWALCEGQLLAISQNDALFSLLGTVYGGDGRTTFGLPDLRGRLAIHAGQGPGLNNHNLGAKFGSENETLTTAQLPNHNHGATSTTEIAVNSSAGEEGIGNGQYISSHTDAFNTAATADKFLGSNPEFDITVGNTGGSQAHTNVQPTLVVNYIICLQGIYPSRN